MCSVRQPNLKYHALINVDNVFMEEQCYRFFAYDIYIYIYDMIFFARSSEKATCLSFVSTHLQYYDVKS